MMGLVSWSMGRDRLILMFVACAASCGTHYAVASGIGGADGGSELTRVVHAASQQVAGEDETATIGSPAPGELVRFCLSSAAKLLFSSGFEDGVRLSPPSGGQQDIVGTDASTGFSWPPSIWGGGAYFQLLDPGVFDNHIASVTGHDGTSTRALYQSVQQNRVGATTQDPLLITPTASLAQQGDLYTSEWIKFQPDLKSQLMPGQMLDGSWGNWRALFEWKTGGQGIAYHGGDYRIILSVAMDNSGNLYWNTRGDNNANGPYPFQKYWTSDNYTVPVSAGQWFRLETFTHRSTGGDGEFWAKVDGQTIVDHIGPNIGVHNDPINRIMLSQVYTGGRTPAYQWVDDVQIWDGIAPSDRSNTSQCNRR
jgi:hypothetical protein